MAGCTSGTAFYTPTPLLRSADNISTYDEPSAVDYKHLFREFNRAHAKFEQYAGRILTENLQDRRARTGLSLAGWKGR